MLQETDVQIEVDDADGVDGDEHSEIPADNGRWRDRAACKGQTSLFFPRRAERPEARERREGRANRLCDQCEVIQPCREFARSHHEYGFWAGESEEERHRLGFTVSAPIGVRIRTPSRAV